MRHVLLQLPHLVLALCDLPEVHMREVCLERGAWPSAVALMGPDALTREAGCDKGWSWPAIDGGQAYAGSLDRATQR